VTWLNEGGSRSELSASGQERIELMLDEELNTAVAALTLGFADLDRAIQGQVSALSQVLAGSGLSPAARRPMVQAAVNIGHLSRSMAAQATAGRNQANSPIRAP
jgi:hypothetical protein